MELKHVTSSNVDKVGYEGTSLFVQFLSGALYEYFNVPRQLYNNFMAAASKGKFLNSEVKGHYEYSRIRWGELNVRLY